MTVVSRKTLDAIKAIMICCWCGKRGPVDPHHLVKRGMGGGGRLDIAINLAPLCRRCHDAAERGDITLIDLLALVAKRENCSSDDIRAALEAFRKLPKRTDPQWHNRLNDLNPMVKQLILNALGE